MNINFEFKAKINAIEQYENKLLTLDPIFHGLDHQVDTYFNSLNGRLKLREGNIENALIHYDRQNIAGTKESQVILYHHKPDSALKEILTKQLGIKVIVDKKRKIYFIGNVKFHFDVVEKLGTFLEVEAISKDGDFSNELLKQQCDRYLQFFELREDDLVDKSYSDLLMK
ncbi:MAG: CYTH domain-containing protein [Chitinophagaceae bacterium]|nr:MAG: CYTH domain-containing protein [Chitinophagaceae bacterium]